MGKGGGSGSMFEKGGLDRDPCMRNGVHKVNEEGIG